MSFVAFVVIIKVRLDVLRARLCSLLYFLLDTTLVVVLHSGKQNVLQEV